MKGADVGAYRTSSSSAAGELLTDGTADRQTLSADDLMKKKHIRDKYGNVKHE